ncbi:GrpE-domain-containing protein [Limtongia smithiae]|uniref:GrpE-domain-containing protein n=1 Tax=Limtongia smithiae TaxID=1125753 RepID=UPI0034CDD7F4
MLRRSLTSTVLRQRTGAYAMRSASSPLSMRLAYGAAQSYSSAADKPTEPIAESADGAAAAAAAAEESGITTKIAELESQLEAKGKEYSELKDKFLRQVADFRNLQETTRREVQNAKDFAIQKFARDLLDSVDNLERALATVPESKRDAATDSTTVEEVEMDKELMALYDGVKMTQQVLEHTLKRHGLEKIDPIGEKFDPHKHEATFEVAQPDKEPGTVFFVQQTGFLLNNRVLRAAKVGVVKS